MSSRNKGPTSKIAELLERRRRAKNRETIGPPPRPRSILVRVLTRGHIRSALFFGEGLDKNGRSVPLPALAKAMEYARRRRGVGARVWIEQAGMRSCVEADMVRFLAQQREAVR